MTPKPHTPHRLRAPQTVRKIKDLLQDNLINPQDLEKLNQVSDNFSPALTNQIYQQIQDTQSSGLKKQFIPDIQELVLKPDERIDPIGDFVHSPVKGIVHRHPDRCLFKVVQVCPVYCRFCFRKEQIGPEKDALTKEEFEKAYQYIEAHPEIWEVILTGGDPLILKPKMLSNILLRLESIPHVDIIRIHTRVPVIDSKRITQELMDCLKLKKTLYIAIHANHPDEFTDDSLKSIATLVDAGIPLLSQTVLLKGVNDKIEILEKLMRLFVKNRIKPYYLHQLDLAPGTSHFRVSIEAGQLLLKELRKTTSGLCQPTYVLDIPGGFGKVPIGESALCEARDLNQAFYEIYDLEGKLHSYPK